MKFRKDFIGLDGFQWWIGVVEDRQDPEKLGRCKVRIFGIHTDDVSLIPTEDLPWAVSVYSVNNSDRFSAPKEGEYVVGFFLDGDFCQAPAILGVLPGVNKANVARSKGFRDRRTLEQIKKSPKKPVSINYTTVPGDSVNVVSGNIVDTSHGVEETAVQIIIQNTPLLLTAEQSLKNSLETVIGYNHVISQKELNQGYISLTNENVLVRGLKGLGTEINSTQARKLLDLDLQNSVVVTKRSLGDSAWNQLNDAQKAALVAISYDAGGDVDFVKTGIRDSILAGNLVRAFQLIISSDLLKTGNTYLVSADSKLKEAAGLFSSTPQNIINALLNDPQAAYIPMTAPGGGKGVEISDPNTSNDLIAESLSYPLAEDVNERSLSSLATNEKVNNTVLKFREKSIITANGAANSTWSEPYPGYAAEYPFNKASETDSGHIFEFDDTPDRERIHLAHRSGSFQEWLSSGTKVEKVVKNNYKIVMSDDHLYVAGRVNIVIDSDVNLRVVGNCHLQVENNIEGKISGSMNVSIGDAFNIRANSMNFDIAQTATIISNTQSFSSNTIVTPGTSVNLPRPQKRGIPTNAPKFLEKDPVVIQDPDTIKKNNDLIEKFRARPELYVASEPNVKPFFPGTPNSGKNPSTGGLSGRSLIVRNPTANIHTWLTNQLTLAENGYWRETGFLIDVGNYAPSNPNILNLWKNLGFKNEFWTSTDQTPWAMAFINYGLKQNGYRYLQTPSAADIRLRFNEYRFTQVASKAFAEPGDIALWSGGHANFVYENHNGSVTYVGAGQSPSASARINDRRIGDVSLVGDTGCTLVGIFRPSKT